MRLVYGTIFSQPLPMTQMSSRQLFKRAVLIGGVLVVFSLAAYNLVPEDAGPLVIMPGMLVGMVAATILAAANGNPHGVKLGVMWAVAIFFNFWCYVAIAYVFLSFWFRGSKNAGDENRS
jgi:hypothetical protein